uniref:LysE family transporter n=1 Tax=Mycobacterium tuberculosis TaxID=1773 RepID=UPI00255145C8
TLNARDQPPAEVSDQRVSGLTGAVHTVVLIGALANEESDLRWFFGAGAWAASVVWFAVLGFSAGRLQPFFATPAAWRILDALVAVTMIGVAVVVLVTSPSVPTANVALII